MSKLSPYMLQAHEHLNDEFEKYVRLKDSDPDASWAAFVEFLDGLRRHMSLEEEILFPSFAARPPAGAETALASLRADHQRLNAILDELQVCQAEFNPHAAALEAELRALLHGHEEHEERLFQPWLITTLSTEELRDLLERMARFGVYVPVAADQ